MSILVMVTRLLQNPLLSHNYVKPLYGAPYCTGSVGELGVSVAWLAARALRGDGRNDSSDCDRDGCDGCDNCDSSTLIGCVSVPLHPRRRFSGAGGIVRAAVRFPAVP